MTPLFFCIECNQRLYAGRYEEWNGEIWPCSARGCSASGCLRWLWVRHRGAGLRVAIGGTGPAVQADAPAVLAAAPANSGLQLECRAAILMEPETGRVLYEKAPDERMPIASITKLMTLLLTFEAIRGGKLTLDTPRAGERTRLPHGRQSDLAGAGGAVHAGRDAAGHLRFLGQRCRCGGGRAGGRQRAGVCGTDERPGGGAGDDQHHLPECLRAGHRGPSLHSAGCCHPEPVPSQYLPGAAALYRHLDGQPAERPDPAGEHQQAPAPVQRYHRAQDRHHQRGGGSASAPAPPGTA